MKIPDCDRCLLYAHNPYIICTVHPMGVDSVRCLDFRPDPNAEIEEQWLPEGIHIMMVNLYAVSWRHALTASELADILAQNK